MDSVSVVSSNIGALGYDSGKLYVKFHSGASYSYDGVPKNVFTDLTKAESVGREFHKKVKGKFRYKRLDIDPF